MRARKHSITRVWMRGCPVVIVLVVAFVISTSTVFLTGCRGLSMADGGTSASSESSAESKPVASAFNDALDAGVRYVRFTDSLRVDGVQSYALVEMNGDDIPELIQVLELEDGGSACAVLAFDQDVQQVRQVGDVIEFDGSLLQGEGEYGTNEYGYGFVCVRQEGYFFVSVADDEVVQQATSSHQPLRPLMMYEIEDRSAIDAIGF